MFRRLLTLVMAMLLVIAAATSCASPEKKDDKKPEEEENVVYEPDDLTVLTDYVDFVVDVPEGREIRVLQLTDVQTVSGDLKRAPNRITESLPADIDNGYKKYINILSHSCK